MSVVCAVWLRASILQEVNKNEQREISVKCVVSKEISVGYDVFNELW